MRLIVLLALLSFPLVQALSVAPAEVDLGKVIPGEHYAYELLVYAPLQTTVLVSNECTRENEQITLRGMKKLQRVFIVPEYIGKGAQVCVLHLEEQAGMVGVSLSVPISMVVSREERHNISIDIPSVVVEQGTSAIGVARIANKGNVQELVCVSKNCSVLFPYQTSEHFFDIKGENHSVEINGRKYRVPVQMVAPGSVSASASMQLNSSCEQGYHVLTGNLRNDGALGGIVDVIISSDQEKEQHSLRTAAGTDNEFSFTTHILCKDSILVSASFYGKEIARDAFSPPLSMTGAIVSTVGKPPIIVSVLLALTAVLVFLARRSLWPLKYR